ncbi:MAG TPA: lysophospholipase [Symbiobacteriaceae bacterium]|nr:lysophospholipase [Symbiobacteriaceae bacterium]
MAPAVEGTFRVADGTELFYRHWQPAVSRGKLVIIHGFNDHSGRFAHVAQYWVDQGLTVWALDLRGHGRSGGPRAFVARWSDYVDDLHAFITGPVGGGVPLLLGHSMGGLITFRYGLAYPDSIKALVITSPLFQNRAQPTPIDAVMAPIASRLLPKLLRPAPLDASKLSRDPAVGTAYAADPLVGKQGTPRWYTEMLKAAGASLTEAPSFRLPILVLAAGADALVDPDATERVYQAIGSSRKRYKRYPEFYHELLNEPEKTSILAEIQAWLDEEGLL